ncbi:unnamed protein product [Acanthoscelides obtectus]|uniref:Uncharacterized protein n=1 Tax=Acanthoscelides obtectus TaxID=200917 RepID=A0A9P0L226_ACAOB|nr:unnamed protein product [Acanthoscelides obtectus]CAK1663277.1 hypothetical protein AOBTE_LOCUS23586 [Acanthoscelides obtectus]
MTYQKTNLSARYKSQSGHLHTRYTFSIKSPVVYSIDTNRKEVYLQTGSMYRLKISQI